MMKTSDAVKDSGNNRHAIVQTTLRVTETETDVQVVSDRGIQTITSTLPTTDNQAVIPFLEFTPYSEIEKDSQRVVDLPRKALLQFDLERKVPKRSNSELNPKGVLKKSSSVVEFDGEQLVSGLQLNNKMSKTQEEQEIQTDLTVSPYILDEDSVAYVCTQLATQTSLTFDPADSLSQITSALKKVLRHTKNFQAVVIDGKLVTDYVDPRADEESKHSRESIDEDGSRRGEISRDEDEAVDAHSKDVSVSTRPSRKSTQKAEASAGAPLQMTEEEFEANVQKILDKTVKNVYEFMAKIVEMYELSKEEGRLPPDTSAKTPVRSFPPVPEEDEEEEIEKQPVVEAPIEKSEAESLQITTGLIRGPKWILQNALKIDVNTGLPLPISKAYETNIKQALEEGSTTIEFIPIDSNEAEEHFSPKKIQKSEPDSERLGTPPPSLTLVNDPLQANTLTEDALTTSDDKTTREEGAEETIPLEEASAAADTAPHEDAPTAAKTSIPATASIVTPLEDLISPGVGELTDGKNLLMEEEPDEGIIPAKFADTSEDSEVVEAAQELEIAEAMETVPSTENVIKEETIPEEDAAETEERPPEGMPSENIGDSRAKPAAGDILCECSRIHEAGAAPPALYQPCGSQETSIKFEVIVLNDGGIKQSVTEGVVVQASVTRPEKSDRPDKGRDIINVSVTVGGQKLKSPSAQLTIEDAESQVLDEAIKDAELQALEGCSCDEEFTGTQQPAEAESVTEEVNPPPESTDPEDIETEPESAPLAGANHPAEQPTEANEPEEMETTEAETQPIDAEGEPVDTEPEVAEPIDTQRGETEPADAEPEVAQPTETEPPQMEIEPEQAELTETQRETEPEGIELADTEPGDAEVIDAKPIEEEPTPPAETNPPAEPKQEQSAQLKKPTSKPSVSINVTASFAEGPCAAAAVQVSEMETQVPVQKTKSKSPAGSVRQSKVTVVVPIQQSEQEIRPPTDYLQQKEVLPKQPQLSGKQSRQQAEGGFRCDCQGSHKPTPPPPQPSHPSAATCNCQEAIIPKSSKVKSKPSAPACSCRKTIVPQPATPVCPCQRSITPKLSAPVCSSHQPIAPTSSAFVCPCQKSITPKPSTPVCPCQRPIDTLSSAHVCPCQKPTTPKFAKSVSPCGCVQAKETAKQEERTQTDEQAKVCACDNTNRGIGVDKQMDKVRSAPALCRTRVCLDKQVQNVCLNRAKDAEPQEEPRRMWPYEPPPKKIHQRFSLPSQNVCPCDRPQEAQPREDECVCGPATDLSQKYKQSIESYIQKLINDSLNARDPGLIQTHIACVGPYLQQVASNLAEEGISGRPLKCTGDASQQCACSVEVLFVNNDAERKDQGCTCSLPREKKPQPQESRRPPPAMVKSCNCDLENEPTPNLECMYEQDDDYYEMYMEDLESGDFFRVEPSESEKEVAVCCQGQLPLDVVETNRCGSKIEIPWLAIALPPPGTIQIIPTGEPKVICDCWKLDLKDSVLSVTEVGQTVRATGERCVCNDSDKLQEQEIEIPPPKPEEGETEEVEKRQDDSQSDDDSSSRCSCNETELDECENLEVTSMNFVYDNPCFAQYEPYMDSIYKHFPDDCDTYCGPFTEIHWSDILLPKKILLRETKRRREPPREFRPGETRKGEDKSPVLPTFSRAKSAESNATSEIEIELSFAQIASTLIKVEGGAASQQTVSEVSAISDVRMQIKRCPKDYVVTVVPDGTPALPGGSHFPTVGSLPFYVEAGGGGVMVSIAPSTRHMPVNPPVDIHTLSHSKPAGGSPKAVTPAGIQQKCSSLPNLSAATLTSLDFHERYPRAMGRPFAKDCTQEKVVTVQDFEGAMYTCLPCQNVVRDDEFLRDPCPPRQDGRSPKSKETPPQKSPLKQPRKEHTQPPTLRDNNISVDTVKSEEFRAKYNLPPPTYEDPECAGLYTIAMPEMQPRLFEIETMMMQNRKIATKQSTSSPGVFQPTQDKRACGSSKCKRMMAQQKIDVCDRVDEILEPEAARASCTCKSFADQAAGRSVARDAAINVREITQKEMKPINQQIDEIKAKLRDMNIPELENWNRFYYSDPMPGGIPSSIPPCPMSSQYSQLPPQMFYSRPPQFGAPQSQPPYLQAPYMPSLYPPDYNQYAYTPDYSMYGPLPSYSYYPYSDSETTEDPLDYVCHCARRRSPARRRKKRKPPISSSECSCVSTSASTPSRGTASAKDIPCSRQSDRNASQVTFSISNQTKIDASNYSDYNQTESEPEVEIRVGRGPPKIRTKSCFKGFISEDPKSKCKFRVAVKVKPSKLLLSPKKEESDESSSYGHTT